MVNCRPIILAALGLFALWGCANNESDGMSKEQTKKAAERDSILTKGDGKWENLSPEDKQKIMSDYGTSDEAEAKRFFERSAQGENMPRQQPGEPNANPGGR